MSLIRATILTGFLGAGKTTLLKRVLTEAHDQKIAVVENEFGEESIDNDILVSDSTERVVQMNNGCICCTIRDDLRGALVGLAERRRSGELDFDRVIIETTGLADPGPVAQTFFLDESVAEQYLLDAIVTLVDAKHANAQLDDRHEARRQVGFADQLYVSKAELVDAGELDGLVRRLKRINARAPIRQAHFGDVPIQDVFDQRGFNLNDKLDIDPDFLHPEDGHGHQHAHADACDHQSHRHDGDCHHHHHDDDVKSFTYRAQKPFDPVKLEQFLSVAVQQYGPQMLRYKGVMHMQGASRKMIFQGVHQVMNSAPGAPWMANEPRISKMVFIGVDLPVEVFERGLDAALA